MAKIVTVKDVAAEVYAYGRELLSYDPEDLREPGQHPDDEVSGDIRLQIHEGSWSIHTGDSQYDQDHRGSWGSSSVGRGISKAEARRIAADLISEAMNDYDEAEQDYLNRHPLSTKD